MQTIKQNRLNEFSYLKCGEIFKSKQNPYMLRCLECREIYLLLESFILHFEEDCQKDAERKRIHGTNTLEDSSSEDENLFGIFGDGKMEIDFEKPDLKKSITLETKLMDENSEKKSTAKLKPKRNPPRMPKLLTHQVVQLIDIYKEYPHLWNTYLAEYYCTNKKKEAIEEMLQALAAKMDLQISEDVLEEYLGGVHESFSKAKRKKLNLPKREKDNFIVKGNLEDFYENLLFLSDHVAPFKCSECDKEVNGTLAYKIHKAQHNGGSPFTCSICNREFTSQTTYIYHAKRHMGDAKHECTECEKKFYGMRELNIHMLEHTGAKPYCCETCGASFRHVQSFTTHRRKHEKSYLHTCDICSRGFYTMECYKDHMNSHTNTRTHICQVCGKAFINKKGLRVHQVIHEDIRKYVCQLCGKSFKHKTGLNQHMRTHAIAKCDESIFEFQKNMDFFS